MTKKLSWIIGTLVAIFLIGLILLPHVKAKLLWQPGDLKSNYPFVIYETSADSGHFVTEHPIISQYSDSKLALAENNIPLYTEDRYKTITMNNGGVIFIDRAPTITVVDGKRIRVVRSWTTTVSDLVTEQKIPEIGKDDRISPDLASAVTDKMTITIVRVQETDIIVTQVINYQTVTKDDPNRFRGEPDIIQQDGKNGQKVLTYHVRREDGIEVSRKLTKTDTTAAVNKIILHATKLKIGRIMSGKASWYSSKYQAASHVLPRGTNVRVTNTANGKSVIIQIQDYMESDDKIIDLRPDIFQQLGVPLSAGIQTVKVEEVLN